MSVWEEAHRLFILFIPNDWCFLLSFTTRRVTALTEGTAAKKKTLGRAIGRMTNRTVTPGAFDDQSEEEGYYPWK